MRQNIENKILELYYEYPEKRFTIRGLSDLSGIPRATIHKYLVHLRKLKIIDYNNEIISGNLFYVKKINYFTEKIVESGLIDYLIKKLNPSSIILFGSIRRGDSIKESDVDLFVESYIKKDIDLKKYEKFIGHKVQLFVEGNISKLHDGLLNNVVNGIKLYGEFKIK